MFIKKLFSNVGEKIKKFVYISYIVESVSAIIAGLIVFCKFLATAYDQIFSLVGLAIMIFGPVVLLFVNWFIYGYGEIISHLSNIDNKTNSDANNAVKMKDEIDSLPEL